VAGDVVEDVKVVRIADFFCGEMPDFFKGSGAIPPKYFRVNPVDIPLPPPLFAEEEVFPVRRQTREALNRVRVDIIAQPDRRRP
jgi:hypothetical protein